MQLGWEPMAEQRKETRGVSLASCGFKKSDDYFLRIFPFSLMWFVFAVITLQNIDDLFAGSCNIKICSVKTDKIIQIQGLFIYYVAGSGINCAAHFFCSTLPNLHLRCVDVNIECRCLCQM